MGASDGSGEPGSPVGTWTLGQVDLEGSPFSSHILHGTLRGSAPPRPLATWQGFCPSLITSPQHTHKHTLTHTLTLTYTHSNAHTLTLTHILTYTHSHSQELPKAAVSAPPSSQTHPAFDLAS